MEIDNTFIIIGGPVKKEYKVPFVSSALVFKNIVGFCFTDFCKKIYANHKHTESVQYSPEYIFAKMMTLRDMKSHGHNARKLAIDLIFLMNYPYRPWYINDNQMDQILDFESLGLDVHSSGYLKLLTIFREKIKHPYLAIAFAMFSDNEAFEFDAVKFSEYLCLVMSNHTIYKHCRDHNLFDHDTVLLALYEVIHQDVLQCKGRFNFDQLTRTILKAVQQKSQTLLMFAQYLAYDHNEKKLHATAFLDAPNYSKTYGYAGSLYENTLRDAITHSDWTLFDKFFPLLSNYLGLEDSTVQSLLVGATTKRTEEQNRSSQANQPAPKKPKSKQEHNFSPYLASAIDLVDVKTADLFGLITLLDAIGDKRGMYLIRERLKYIFPSEGAVFSMLYNLISSHIIKIEEKHFDAIPDSKVNLWESYLNAPFEVNVIGLIGDSAIISSLLKDELLRRSDNLEVCLKAWRELSHSYFYSSYEYYSGNVTDDWIREYEITEEFKQNISKAQLSCRKFSYIAFSAVKNAVSFHHMGETTGNHHTRNMMTFYLKKYLNLAETSPHDYSKPRMETAPVFQIEQLIGLVTGISPEDIYSHTPSLNLLNA